MPRGSPNSVDEDGLPTLGLQDALKAIAAKAKLEKLKKSQNIESQQVPETLSRTIIFPYSRHASYPELCHLISLFKPKDVWPCTVDKQDWVKNRQYFAPGPNS